MLIAGVRVYAATRATRAREHASTRAREQCTYVPMCVRMSSDVPTEEVGDWGVASPPPPQTKNYKDAPSPKNDFLSSKKNNCKHILLKNFECQFS